MGAFTGFLGHDLRDVVVVHDVGIGMRGGVRRTKGE